MAPTYVVISEDTRSQIILPSKENIVLNDISEHKIEHIEEVPCNKAKNLLRRCGTKVKQAWTALQVQTIRRRNLYVIRTVYHGSGAGSWRNRVGLGHRWRGAGICGNSVFDRTRCRHHDGGIAHSCQGSVFLIFLPPWVPGLRPH